MTLRIGQLVLFRGDPYRVKRIDGTLVTIEDDAGFAFTVQLAAVSLP